MRVQQLPIIAPSAYKHGEGDDDILHAVRNVMITHVGDEGFTMVVGPTTDAVLIEVGYVSSTDDRMLIIHAFRPAQPEYLR